jgi:hypothetical protein
MDDVARALDANAATQLVILTKLYERGLLNEADMIEVANKLRSINASAGAEEASQLWLDAIMRMPSLRSSG